jgi:di/tricarboxylate transporter
MTVDIAITLAIIVVALLLFATEKLRVDIVAMLVLITVGVLRLIPPQQVFSGFSNSAVITVWAVYMVSGGMFKTGVAEMLGNAILKVAGNKEAGLVSTIMATVGVLSAFMNNVGAVAMLLPSVVGISRKTKVPVSKLLIPLAFASLMGGALTLIGTPANILAAGILSEHQLGSFGFFEFAPMGMVVLITGIVYMVLIGRRLIPVRTSEQGKMGPFTLRDYVTEAMVSPTSQLVGKTLFESRLGRDHDVTVLAIQREDGETPALNRDIQFRPGDLVVVETSASNILGALQPLGLISATSASSETARIQPENTQLIEATLAPNSRVVGQSLNESRFRERYGFTALAISRHGEVIIQRLRDTHLQFGDALLLQGPEHRIAELQAGEDFLVLEPMKFDPPRKNKAIFAVGALLGAIGLVLSGQMDVSLAMVIAAMAIVLTGALTIEEAYESIDWRTVFLVAGMLPLGLAMESTGTARYLADLILGSLGQYGVLATLAGVYLLAAAVTQPMSNAAAIVLIVPIALDTAFGLGANYKTFTMAAVIGATTSFLSPVGHKANVLIFGPGGYRFTDYARVGALLTVLLLIVSMIFLPLIWPLFPN